MLDFDRDQRDGCCRLAVVHPSCLIITSNEDQLSTVHGTITPFFQYQKVHGDMKPSTQAAPRLYLVICNIQKLANVRALMKTAFAFGCLEVWVVGQAKNNRNSQWIPRAFQQAMDAGAVLLREFPKWKDCLAYLETTDIPLVGVEIDATSVVLDTNFSPQHAQMAILMGNEGQGIHPKHLEACNGGLIRIPQYGTGTASLNVNVACSIVLYHISQWKYQQTENADTT